MVNTSESKKTLRVDVARRTRIRENRAGITLAVVIGHQRRYSEYSHPFYRGIPITKFVQRVKNTRLCNMLIPVLLRMHNICKKINNIKNKKIPHL